MRIQTHIMFTDTIIMIPKPYYYHNEMYVCTCTTKLFCFPLLELIIFTKDDHNNYVTDHLFNSNKIK